MSTGFILTEISVEILTETSSSNNTGTNETNDSETNDSNDTETNDTNESKYTDTIETNDETNESKYSETNETNDSNEFETETTDTNDDNDDASTDSSEFETDSYESVSSDNSMSGHGRMLSIDRVILQPILDSPIIEDNVIAKENETDNKTDYKSDSETHLSKPIESINELKICNEFSELLSLFASDCVINEKQIKDLCHKEIIELLSNENDSKHCSIIKNIEIIDNKLQNVLSDIVINIFKNSNNSININENEQCFNIWNIGLIMLFMIIGKNKIIEKMNKFEHLNDLQSFLWDLYVTNKISTNLFDLLYFFMFIFETNECEKELSWRYNQISKHLFFNNECTMDL